MIRRKLGRNGPEVSAIGLGCMSFAGFYGATDREESFRCLDEARDLGIDFLDTAELYGMGVSEEVIGTYMADRKATFHIATKGGIVPKPTRHFNNSTSYFRDALDKSLKRLGVERITLYYAHRHDAEVPVEEVAGTLSRFVDEGKIGGIGFSEIAPATLRRAHAAHPVAAIQNEYSLWTRLPELGMLQATEELGVAFVAFSPLGRGIFAETPPDPARFAETDFRRSNPRFQEPNWSANLLWVEGFRSYCHARGWTVPAAAVAWTLDRAPHILSIPGTRSPAHLRELAAAAAITFTEEDRREIARLMPPGFAHGPRYSEAQHKGVPVYG